MKLNYFKAAEEEISSLNDLKRSLEVLRKRQNRIIAEGAPHLPVAIDYSKSYTNAAYVNNTLNELLELSETERAISATERKIQEIELILDMLSEEQRKVLTMFYIEKQPAETIAEELSYEAVKSVYNIRNRAVAAYALIACGAYSQQI